jgi:hypothetical protein
MTKYKIQAEAAALQQEIDQNLRNTLARNQALRDRANDLAAKAAALVAKNKKAR